MRSVFYSRCYTKIIYYYGFIVVIYDVINGVASCRITSAQSGSLFASQITLKVTELQSLSYGEAFDAMSDVVVARLMTLLCIIIPRGTLNAESFVIVLPWWRMVRFWNVFVKIFFFFCVSISGMTDSDCMFRFLTRGWWVMKKKKDR